MGTTFSNWHVHTQRGTPSIGAIKQLLDERPLNDTAYFISDEAGGWISVYPAQDARGGMAGPPTLSKVLSTAVLHLWEHDSDRVGYELYEHGVERDRFDSAPDQRAGKRGRKGRSRAPVEGHTPFRGDPDALLPYCVEGTAREAIDAALRRTGDDALNRLSNAIPDGGDPEAFRTGIVAQLDASMAQFRAAFGDSLPSERPLQESWTSVYLNSIDADMVAADLAELLGIGTERYHHRFRHLQQGEATFPVELVGVERLPQTAKDEALDGAARSLGLVALRENARGMLARWLEAGANPNPDPSSPLPRSPLISAVNAQDLEGVKLLLAAGAHAHARGPRGLTPVEAARQNQGLGNAEVAAQIFHLLLGEP